MSEIDPLVERVDALLRRHRTHAADERGEEPDSEGDIPILTDIVDPVQAVAPHPQVGGPYSAQRAAQLEHAVLQRVLAELDQTLDRRLARSLGDLLHEVQQNLRAELAVQVREMVREAIAAAVTRELATTAPPAEPDTEERSA